MSNSVLVDTNIILDMAIQSRPEHDYAIKLGRMMTNMQTKGYLCASSLKDVYYVLKKHMGSADARAYVIATMDVFDICAVDRFICKQAAESEEPDFEDGIVRACAERKRVDFIISRDKNAFAHCSIKSMSAKDYVNLRR